MEEDNSVQTIIKRMAHALCKTLLTCLHFILIADLIFHPMLASANGIVAAPGGPGVTSAGNGVPVVNINRPTSGNSLNQYQHFNVGREGAVLNNSPIGGTSSLAGHVPGNPNLSGVGSASLIINEVTSSHPSSLTGKLEVVGNKAKVLVANPNGITCDGCGFINTPNVTLSTGKPVINPSNGNVQLQVRSGTLHIGPSGLNGSGVDQVDLLAHKVTLNGKVNGAKTLSVVGGHFDKEEATGSITATAAGGAENHYAIDASAVGGMEAGRIFIMSTDQGTGVKLGGKIATTVSDIDINSNGDVVLGNNVTSQGHLSVTARGKLQKTDNSYSFGSTTIHANTIENSGRIESDDVMTITTSGNFTNSGKLDSSGDFTLKVDGKTTNTGLIDVGGDLHVVAGDDFTNSNTKTIARGTIRFDGQGQLINNASDLYGMEGVTIHATNLHHEGDAFLGSIGGIDIYASGSVDNLSSLIHGENNIHILAGGTVDNTEGIIEALQDLTITGGSINNTKGILTAGGNMSLTTTSGDINNTQGLIQANGNLLCSASRVMKW